MAVSTSTFGIDPATGTVLQYVPPNALLASAPAADPSPPASPPQYSETEQATAGLWLDGKTIYQRTIQTGPLNGGESAPHNIANIEMVVGIDGISYGPGPGIGNPQVWSDAAGLFDADATLIYASRLLTNQNPGDYNYVTLSYTCTDR